MLKREMTLGIVVVVAVCLLAAAPAAVSPDDVSQLGKKLTPMGAIQAGTDSGTIPPWEGGIKAPIPGWKSGQHSPDPFPEDKPLYRVDSSNYEDYAQFLSAGQMAMFQRYPDSWYMDVYPSRRTVAYPEDIYAASVENASTASLTPDGNGVNNCRRTSPFPIPENGLHGIWNHMLRYRGESIQRTIGQVAPRPDGAYTMVRIEEQVLWRYNREGMTSANS
ncbi:MAG TPA: DUF1329 domain-containing protein, partial [Planctomycetes bacterium]|nr:DUF1329 domain-containing protein [Planctomycetota bacterium]